MTAQGRSSCPAIHDIGCCDGWGREQASVSTISYFCAMGTTVPDRNSFNMLWLRQISFHSALTFCNPRRKNRRKPRPSLICPNTGSTIAFLLRYTACPASLLNFCFICSRNETEPWASATDASLSSLSSPCFCFPVAIYKSTPCRRASAICWLFQ